MEELFLAAELAFTQFPMKTKEMLDQPLAGIRVRLLYLLLEFGDRAVPPQNILAKLFLVGEGYGSAIRVCGLPSVHPVREVRVGSVRGWPQRETEHRCFRFPKKRIATRMPAMPLRAKGTRRRDTFINTPNWCQAKRRPLTDLRFGPSQVAEGAKRNSPGYVFKERRQLQLRLRGKFASMFAASF